MASLACKKLSHLSFGAVISDKKLRLDPREKPHFVCSCVSTLKRLRAFYMSQEMAQRDRLSSAVQEDMERLQASHAVQLEKLRLQHDTEFQKLQLMNSRKVRPSERRTCHRNAAVTSGEESV